MKRKSIVGKLAASLLLLVFLLYIGYQVVQNLSEQIQTADALLVTAEDILSVEGSFLRDQQVLRGNSHETTEFLTDDGEKVAKGQEIALFFSDSASVEAYRQSKALADRMDSVRYTYTHLSDGADSLKLDSLIHLSMVKVGAGLDDGSVATVEGEYANLCELIVRRESEPLDESSYQALMSQLEAQKASLDAKIHGSSAVTAPESGYFFKEADGYEALLIPERWEELTEADLLFSQPDPSSRAGDVMGCLVSGYEWQYAAVMDTDQAESLRSSKKLKLRFPQLSTKTVEAQIVDIRELAQGRSAVLFRCGVMDEVFLTARQQSVDIVRADYTGLKVPKAALRQVDGEWGVFCLVGAIARFKPVEILYQTDSYYLIKPAASSKEGLVLYDKIIVRAKGLEKDKVMK